MVIVTVWILYPRLGRASSYGQMPVKIVQVSPDGKKSTLETLTLRRNSLEEVKEREGLLEELVQSQINKGRRNLILDLGTLEHTDDPLVGEIVALSLSRELKCELVFVNPTLGVRQIFQQLYLMNMLGDPLPVFDSVPDAIQHLVNRSQLLAKGPD